MKTNDLITIGGVEFTRSQVCNMADDCQFVVTCRAVYMVEWSCAQGTGYGRKVWKSDTNLAQRGRFHVMDAKGVNALIGHNLFVTV
jgi:hypothetical protein